MKKQILFVCKHNRFRSKTAEAFFNKLNKNKNYACFSAGLFPGEYPLDKIQSEVAIKFGIKISGKPRSITTKILRNTDIIIIVADDVPEVLFKYRLYKGKIIVWKINDVVLHTPEEIKEIISQIEKKVIEFIGDLK